MTLFWVKMPEHQESTIALAPVPLERRSPSVAQVGFGFVAVLSQSPQYSVAIVRVCHCAWLLEISSLSYTKEIHMLSIAFNFLFCVCGHHLFGLSILLRLI